MELRPNEKVFKTYRRHRTPYYFKLFKITIAMIPFIFIIWFLAESTPTYVTIILSFVLLVGYLFVILYKSLMYWLDHFSVTDQRVVLVNWLSITRREEYEANLTEIQDIKTKENGFLSRWRFFDYGIIKVETSASSTTIEFDNAPDPEKIKTYLAHRLPRRQSHNTVDSPVHSSSHD